MRLTTKTNLAARVLMACAANAQYSLRIAQIPLAADGAIL